MKARKIAPASNSSRYKISAYVRGDTAWITGEWEGGHPHKFSSDVTVTVPRDMELVKIETEGGEIVTTGIAGRLEARERRWHDSSG